MGPSVAVAAVWTLLCAVSLVMAAKPGRVPKTEHSHACSRELSRTVHRRFQAHVARKHAAARSTNSSWNWPDGCPFSPWVNIFGWHEKNKTKSKSGPQAYEWMCNYSGKTFMSEHYIDLHMETKYMKEAPENGVCLADYCEVFGFCNVKPPGLFESLSAEPPPCDPTVLEAQKRTCHSVCDRCAHPDNPAMPNLNADLHRSLCEPLTCELRAEKHHSNRKLTIFCGVFLSVCAIGIFLCCVCISPPESPPKRSYGKDTSYRNAGKHGDPKHGLYATSRVQKPSTDILVDIMPTKPTMPTKPIKQE